MCNVRQEELQNDCLDTASASPIGADNTVNNLTRAANHH